MKGLLTDAQDDFEHWLAFQEEALEAFLDFTSLDIDPEFSIRSLEDLELWLLETFWALEDLERHPDHWDGASRYLGEVSRRNAGGRWHLSVENPASAFFGMPVIRGLAGGSAPELCPLTLVSTAVSRRTGSFLAGIARRIVPG